MEDKPTLRVLMNKHSVSPVQVAAVSGITVMTITAMASRVSLAPEEVQLRVLDAFNKIAKTNYAYDDVELRHHKKSEIVTCNTAQEARMSHYD